MDLSAALLGPRSHRYYTDSPTCLYNRFNLSWSHSFIRFKAHLGAKVSYDLGVQGMTQGVRLSEVKCDCGCIPILKNCDYTKGYIILQKKKS